LRKTDVRTGPRAFVFKACSGIVQALSRTKTKSPFCTRLFVQQLFDNLIASKTIFGESNNSHPNVQPKASEEINMARKVKKAAKKSAPKARKAKKTVRKVARKPAAKKARKTVRKAAKKPVRKVARKTAKKPVRRARKAAAKPVAAM
jgi:hypothetical protein